LENSKKIDVNNINEIRNSLDDKSLKVCVVGIGRIGLPTALSFAKAGLQTIGMDINTKLVDSLNQGNFPLKDEPGYEDIFNNAIKNGNFSATTDINEAVSKSNLILLSLPTPMDKKNIPDYSALESVCKQLSDILQPNSLIVVESTIEPGFVENTLINILEKTNRLHVGKNFTIGVCPENANPGEILHDFTNLPRLVGSIDEQTTKIITMIYDFVFSVELIIMPDCKTANAVKLTTNVFRDVNIAFVNELSLMFDKLGIDTLKVLDAAKRKYNFQIHYPGAGVGGPCLPINSYQFLNTAIRINSKLSIIEQSREINEKMPDYVINLTLDGFKKCNKSIKDSNILILGISYKPDVKDVQLSPAEIIINKLKDLGARVRIYDPYYKNSEVFGINVESNMKDAIPKADASIIITAHKEFQEINPQIFTKMNTPILIDSRGVIDTSSIKDTNLVFRGIGRGI
jgi:nucleotide sugar dehydrogenase|tara:strand:- start:74 stop:1447 length:1374 start_codon:yes stop_codon:yes gene_type:complete